ncbi:HoxN/HupN/NixA family nickel/cobalt transporter [Methylobacterium sp. Leaf89]|uniref:HoxN/HupN/NixA family nickel/cobalt transporter n=1 Tax=Methylobacterium sp. Leaf89 TaxID=1736245 RepID=UPI0006F24FC2|nr:HoxN/HupN/NixA family nickel/cobalt transporter [Methylobacterium sp. Leaf89]KQO69185.1 nickel transporter [Methylobacterium sp. Leaf89]
MILSISTDQGPRGSTGRRIGALYLFLISANVAAWAWAYDLFAGNAALLSTAVLAYVLGLRHAVDPDHIAAIDNVTRKLMQAGERPVAVGLWFALGHSTVVVAAAAFVALATTSMLDVPGRYRELGSLVGTGVSATFLILIGLVNCVVLAGVFRSFLRLRRGEGDERRDTEGMPPRHGVLTRLLRPLFRLITRSWHMYPLGLLFALGFETATEISLFGLSAAQAGGGADLRLVFVFAALFTAGMTLVDATDGVLMLGAYSWAFVQPKRKMLYNLIVTFLSVVVALGIGTYEALDLVVDKFGSSSGIGAWLGGISDHYDTLGFGIVGAFALAWAMSWIMHRRAGASRSDADAIEPHPGTGSMVVVREGA